MRNCSPVSGVYRTMHRLPLLLVCSLTAAAQMRGQLQLDPMGAAIRDIESAQRAGNYDEAVARREEARALLQHTPADSPQFAGWAQQLSSSYQNSGLNAKGRAVLEEALSRTAALGESNAAHISLLSSLGYAWQRDGSLLKAVSYLERSAAAEAAAPPPPPSPDGPRAVMVSGRFSRTMYPNRMGNLLNIYQNLAGIYRQLGRPDAIASIMTKLKAALGSNPMMLAQAYEQQDQLDEAAAILKQVAENPSDPAASVTAWQELANLDARQEHFSDAVDHMQKALAVVQSSSQPGIRSQAFWIRNSLAGYLRNAGMADQAEQAYRQLVQDYQGQPYEVQAVGSYAQFLSSTNRGSQGQSLLQQYLSSASDNQQKMAAYFQLSNLARNNGDSKAAEQYQAEAQALLPVHLPTGDLNPGDTHVGAELEQAQKAINAHQLDDAYRLALHAVDSATYGAAANQFEWRIPSIANAFANNHESAKAEQLFRRLIAFAQTNSAYNGQQLINTLQSYARFLMGHKDRAGDVPAAIEAFSSASVSANGPESASVAEPLRLKLEFARDQSQWGAADAAARELLQLQESLTGNTSQPYLRDLQQAALTYEAAKEYARALPLRRQAILVADLVAPPNRTPDWQRAQTRMDTAMTLAHLGQFDEAESLAEEAATMRAAQRSPRPPMSPEVGQIRQMKKAALTVKEADVKQ